MHDPAQNQIFQVFPLEIFFRVVWHKPPPKEKVYSNTEFKTKVQLYELRKRKPVV